MLYYAEKWNGFGPRMYHASVVGATGYVWSYTDQYKIGKYTSDHGFDPTVYDLQIGVAPLLLGLIGR